LPDRLRDNAWSVSSQPKNKMTNRSEMPDLNRVAPFDQLLKHQLLKHQLLKHQVLALKHQLSKTSTVYNINCLKHQLSKTSIGQNIN
jgi:hypothetical protein